MASAAFLIYSGIMPLIKTFLSIFFGYILARKDLFPAAASRGASQVTMNLSLPALIFANIVPAFTPQNISALGPLFLLAFVYQGIGFLFGLIIRELFYVPRNFWQGLIIISGMSNWGNLPNAVVLSVTQQAPFDPATDPALGVSFVSIFIVSYHLAFWVCGAAHSLSWDYLPGIPQGQEAERRLPWYEKPIGRILCRYVLRREFPSSAKISVVTQCVDTDPSPPQTEKVAGHSEQSQDLQAASFFHSSSEQGVDPDIQLARRTSRVSTASQFGRPLQPGSQNSVVPSVLQSAASSATQLPQHPAIIPSILYRIFRPLSVIFTPVTCTLLVSLPIALIQPLKALFVDVSPIGGPDWKGPDGRPPLAFIIDTAQFVGDIAIPLALILLGASFARLKVPRPLSRLPILAMVAVALAKMLLLPVIGVFMVQAMVKKGLIDRGAKAEKFVAMFLSGTPAAVNQLIVSSIYAPDGNVDTLSAFLLVQYVFMFFSSSALTAVALLLS